VSEWARERESQCVCVCERERDRERQRKRERATEREQEGDLGRVGEGVERLPPALHVPYLKGAGFRVKGLGFRVQWFQSGLVLRLIDSCITQLKAQGPARTCNESKEEEKKV